MADMKHSQTRIRAAVMRGGTSKGLYFLAEDLPADSAARDAVLAGRLAEADAYFAAEYRMNGVIATYSKPIAALGHGAVMGGGIGILGHAAFSFATVEARWTLDAWTRPVPGQFQLIAFVDAGEVDYAKDPWFTGPNHARRSGGGLGVNWFGPHDLSVRVAYARRFNDQISTSGPDHQGRVWFQIVKLF